MTRRDAASIPCPVAARAAAAPHRPALRLDGQTISYGEWHARVCACEAFLRDRGVSANSRVALTVTDRAAMLTLLVALFRTGAVACPLDPAFPPEYRRKLETQAGCTHSLTGAEVAPPPTHDPVSGESRREPSRWDTQRPATIIFTSGSSGAPKAAVLALGNHLASARRANRNIPLHDDSAWLLSLPLHHVAGFGILFRCLEAGAAIALPGDRPLKDAIVRTGATHLSLVARQLAQLMDAGPVPPLQAILLGGSAIPAPLLDRAVSAGLPVHTSYGMTESATQIAATPPGASRAVLATSGRPLAPDTLRINDDGRIQINGTARFLGYWDGGRLQQPFDSDGWFTTGDCGFLDDDGLLHVTGRADNMFVAGGENIQPEEIERALLRLPGITQAVVVPVPHPEFGATPVAFVDSEEPPDMGAIRDALSIDLPRFQVPKHIFPWPSDLDRPGTKIQRAHFIQRALETTPRHPGTHA